MGSVREGFRIVKHSLRVKRRGRAWYAGDAKMICRAVVDECWDAKRQYYKTSKHNYPLFYARDFGLCADSLLALGEKERVRLTLAYALSRYEKFGRVTQQIGVDGAPFNFPAYESPDSLALLLHSIVALKDKELVKKYGKFLAGEVDRVLDAIVDASTGLVKRDIRVAGMRDYAIRQSSCYDNVMVAAIVQYSRALQLKGELHKNSGKNADPHYEKLLLENFWTGSYFKDDLASDACTGDANAAVFWFRIITDEKKEKEYFQKVLNEIKRRRLDCPVALRYEGEGATTKMSKLDSLTGGWERDTAWLHLGNLFLQACARLDPKAAREHLIGHRVVIEHEHNYPEVLTREGKPHGSFWFESDDTMLWAANYLALAEQFERMPRPPRRTRTRGGGRKPRQSRQVETKHEMRRPSRLNSRRSGVKARRETGRQLSRKKK